MRLRKVFAAALAVGLAAVIMPSASSAALPGVADDWTVGGPGLKAPVKCAAGDITPDDRVFPEPEVSVTWLTLADFECGITLLAQQHLNMIDIDTLGNSAGGHPIYDIKVTNETIPNSEKRHLFIMNSIHGDEPAGREGGARVIEDIVDSRFMANDPFVVQTLDKFVVHFVFPNPDGWAAGEIAGAGAYSRTNDGNRDLNRNFPVQGFLRAANGTLDQPEGRGVDQLLLKHADPGVDMDDPDYRGWYLGTDNHGQGEKPVAASGLQIVGQFDFRKSERLAHFADSIEPAMAEYGLLDVLQIANENTDGAIRPYEWGTLYDILGYSASGSGIDYYNTPGVIEGTGFATEITGADAAIHQGIHPTLLNQMWVNAVRAINYTLMRDAVDPPNFTFPVGGKAAYVFDPAIVTDADANGFGPGNASIPSNFTGDDPQVNPAFEFGHYQATRMKFFHDLNRYASNPLDKLTVADILEDPSLLADYDSLVLADNPMPGDGDPEAWVSALQTFVENGGNLIVTDAAAPVIAGISDPITTTDITLQKSNVGYVDFPSDRSDPLNAGLRGVASQTYDVIPIGIPDGGGQAPNFRVATAAWEAAGGITAGTTGGQMSYGELPVGSGRIRFLGALLPQPSEEFFHPYGLQNYAVTYTGYTLLQNMLVWDRDAGAQGAQ